MTKISEIIVQFCIGLAIIDVAWAGLDIPTDPTKVESWFAETITPAASRKATLDPNLVDAEASPVTIKVRKDGSGDFGTVQKALDSVKQANKVRTIIDIGPGVYKEKVTIESDKPFITFLGDPKNMPTIDWDDNSVKTKGTDSTYTVLANSDYFIASHIIFKNSAPRPNLRTTDGQALALRIDAHNAAVYNCRMIGFQDTLGDDKFNHFFKDCYIEGTVDFVFGAARSIFLNCELHVVPGDNMAMVTASYRENADQEGTFVIVHSKLTGTGKIAFLGRTWSNFPQVIFMYSTMSDVVKPEGWSNHNTPASEKTAYFAELENKGDGADTSQRVPWVTKVTPEQAKKFLTIDYINGTRWLLPPPGAKGSSSPASAESPSAESPSAESPSTETPSAETPSAESPSAESPSDKSSSDKSSSAESPSAESPSGKSSSSKSASDESPSAETPSSKSPSSKSSSSKSSSDDASSDETPSKSSSSKSSSDDASSDETPSKSSSSKSSSDDASSDETSSKSSSSKSSSKSKSSSDDAPSDETPSKSSES